MQCGGIDPRHERLLVLNRYRSVIDRGVWLAPHWAGTDSGTGSGRVPELLGPVVFRTDPKFF